PGPRAPPPPPRCPPVPSRARSSPSPGRSCPRYADHHGRHTAWRDRAILDIVAGAYGHVVSSKQVLDTMSAWAFAVPTALLKEPRYAGAADVLGDHAGQHPAVRG